MEGAASARSHELLPRAFGINPKLLGGVARPSTTRSYGIPKKGDYPEMLMLQSLLPVPVSKDQNIVFLCL